MSCCQYLDSVKNSRGEVTQAKPFDIQRTLIEPALLKVRFLTHERQAEQSACKESPSP